MDFLSDTIAGLAAKVLQQICHNADAHGITIPLRDLTKYGLAPTMAALKRSFVDGQMDALKRGVDHVE